MAPPRIRALPQAVADAIAAGEVVERPASVVKELCENALDAGATRIEVDIGGGGLTRIAVLDDGAGMEREDLGLAVARHATSKIGSAQDLSHIGTLGFRGEALASIAAVSDLQITSRPRDRPAAATLHVRAGVLIGGGDAGAAPGTCIEVCDLFANTPARLRFLRSPRTETAAAVRVVSDLVLSRPEVAFVCRTEGRTALRSPGGDLRDAAGTVFGRAASGGLISIGHGDGILVAGLICPPGDHRATRGGLVLVVNGRRIHNRALVVAVEGAYRGLIPSDRHPFGVVTIAMAAEEVDVNVHPSKREVRFRDEGAVFAAVQRACWVGLQGARAPLATVTPAGVDHSGPITGGGPAPWPGRDLSVGAPARPAAALVSAALALHSPTAEPGVADDPAPLRALGQAGGEWIVAASGSDVVLVDPHAAHEKILYAPLVAGSAPPTVQLLLVPAVVECDAVRMERFEQHAELVSACGLQLERFGPTLLRCTGVPLGTAGADVGSMVADLLDLLDEGRGGPSDLRHRIAATVACHAAVRFGDVLSADEQQRILDLLPGTPGWMTCPHGRPTTLLLDRSALRRAFRRPLD